MAVESSCSLLRQVHQKLFEHSVEVFGLVHEERVSGLGGFVPFTWLAVESLHAYSQSRQRVHMGLCDPLVNNHFFLVGLYGILASSTYPICLWMYIRYERDGVWSDPLMAFLGIVEVISLAALWISFAAPTFYRSWIEKARAPA